MKKVSFHLTMPNNNSWNGKWTGDAKKYFVIRSLAEDVAEKLPGNYYYNFGDGWGANVKVEIVDDIEARKRQKESDGFWSYEWMIDSIIRDGKIIVKDKVVG